MSCVLRTEGLSRKYKDFYAVNNINININKGEIYGFLGQNGAGKTTTIRMIMGLIRPTEGYIELFGKKVGFNETEHYRKIGSIIDYPGFYGNLTAEENLDIHRRLLGVKDKGTIKEVLQITGISDTKKKKVKNFSLGMKQRLGIACAILNYPELLILDEPTNGLDPIGIQEIRNLLIELVKNRGITILVSSHILSEVHKVATKIGIIHNGNMVKEIGINDLELENRLYIEATIDNDSKATMILEEKLGIFDYSVISPGTIRVNCDQADTNQINQLWVQNGIQVKDIHTVKRSLEDYFMEIIGGEKNV